MSLQTAVKHVVMRGCRPQLTQDPNRVQLAGRLHHTAQHRVAKHRIAHHVEAEPGVRTGRPLPRDPRGGLLDPRGRRRRHVDHGAAALSQLQVKRLLLALNALLGALDQRRQLAGGCEPNPDARAPPSGCWSTRSNARSWLPIPSAPSEISAPQGAVWCHKRRHRTPSNSTNRNPER